jgi:hypothetical protein
MVKPPPPRYSYNREKKTRIISKRTKEKPNDHQPKEQKEACRMEKKLLSRDVLNMCVCGVTNRSNFDQISTLLLVKNSGSFQCSCAQAMQH